MLKVSILSRLVIFASALLLVTIASNVYLRSKVDKGAEMLVADERLVDKLETAIDASRAFGDLKYWLLELSVVPRARTHANVIDSRRLLAEKLDALESFDPEGVAVLRLEMGSLMDTTLIAIESYTENKRALGDSFLAKGLEHIRVLDRRLSDLATISSMRLALVARMRSSMHGGRVTHRSQRR